MDSLLAALSAAAAAATSAAGVGGDSSSRPNAATRAHAQTAVSAALFSLVDAAPHDRAALLAAFQSHAALRCCVADSVFDGLATYEKAPDSLSDAWGSPRHASVDSTAPPCTEVCRALATLRAPLDLLPLLLAALRASVALRIQTSLAASGSDTTALLPTLKWVARTVLPFASLVLLPPDARKTLFLSLRGTRWPDAVLRRLGPAHTGTVLRAVRVTAQALLHGGGADSAAYSPFGERGRHAPHTTTPAALGRGLAGSRPGNSDLDAQTAALATLASDLTAHVYACMLRGRTAQLFDLIVDHPDSAAAVSDLTASVGVLGEAARSSISKSLVATLHARLLHPGAATSDILEMFVKALRVLAAVDPSGIVVGPVADAVRVYLRHRSDTVRVIVQSLTEDVDSELHAELSRRRERLGGPAPARGGGGGGYVVDEDDDGEAVVGLGDQVAPLLGGEGAGRGDGSDDGGSGGDVSDKDDGGKMDDGEEGEGRGENTAPRSSSSEAKADLFRLLTLPPPPATLEVPSSSPSTRLHTLLTQPRALILMVLLGGGGGTEGGAPSLGGGGSSSSFMAPSALLPFLLPTAGSAHDAPAAVPRPSLWQPAPREADGGQPHLAADLLATLVGVFGSPDSFIAEYRALLAERLLGKRGDDFDTEHDER